MLHSKNPGRAMYSSHLLRKFITIKKRTQSSERGKVVSSTLQSKGYQPMCLCDIIWRTVDGLLGTMLFINPFLVMMGNVFLHLHPVKVSRQAMKITYTWCMGGITFFLFLLLTITGVFLMFYYIPDTHAAYQNIQQLSSAVSFGNLVRNMHRWAAHLMVVSVTLHMIRVFYHGAYKPPREFNWVVGVGLSLSLCS